MASEGRHLSTPRGARRCPHIGSPTAPSGGPAGNPQIARKRRLDEDLSGGRRAVTDAAVAAGRGTLPTAPIHILSTGRGKPESESERIDLRGSATGRFRLGHLHLREALAPAVHQRRDV